MGRREFFIRSFISFDILFCSIWIAVWEDHARKALVLILQRGVSCTILNSNDSTKIRKALQLETRWRAYAKRTSQKQSCQFRIGGHTGLTKGTTYFYRYWSIPMYRFMVTAIFFLFLFLISNKLYWNCPSIIEVCCETIKRTMKSTNSNQLHQGGNREQAYHPLKQRVFMFIWIEF